MCVLVLQNLWPIFLTHLMEVLHSGNSVTRAAGLEALDRCLTGGWGVLHAAQRHARWRALAALSVAASIHRMQADVAVHLSTQDHPSSNCRLVDSLVCLAVSAVAGAIAAPDLGQLPTQPQQPPVLSSLPSFRQQHADGSGSGQAVEGHAADVEHMLLVALEGMYKEEREPDVRLGLLRVALHVLQRHGEALSRCAG